MSAMQATDESMKCVAVLTADWHLSDRCPICRNDDPVSAQLGKLDQILNIALAHGAPLIVAGDLFDSWQPSNCYSLLPKLLRLLRRKAVDIYAIPGQHDLPQHAMSLKYKSSYELLCAAGCISDLTAASPCEFGDGLLVGVPFGEAPGIEGAQRDIVAMHRLIWEREPPYKNAPASGNVACVLDSCPGFGAIVAGDNHVGFSCCGPSGRLVVNCGTTWRADASMASYEPSVWLLWRGDAGFSATQERLAVDAAAVSSRHLEEARIRTDRASKFIQSVKQSCRKGVSFAKNIEAALRAANLPDDVVAAVNKAVLE